MPELKTLKIYRVSHHDVHDKLVVADNLSEATDKWKEWAESYYCITDDVDPKYIEGVHLESNFS